MPSQSPDTTTVLATYPARHYAEMARDCLSDNDIESYVAADDVHVQLQLTEGVRLLVMQSQAQNARAVLEDARLLPESLDTSD
jgi:hypothetical protein